MVSSKEANNDDILSIEANYDGVIDSINVSIGNVIEIPTHSFGSMKEIDKNNEDL